MGIYITASAISLRYNNEEKGWRRTMPREMKPQTDAAQPLPRLWYMAVMKSGIAAPDPERMTVFAASAEAT